MNIKLLSIDIAKNVFQLHGNDATGKCVFKKRVSRNKLVETIINIKPCAIVLESCGGSSYWYRKFTAMGHTVKLIAPQYVKPFVKTNKNDANDAEAIAEAASRPSMRYVEPKTIAQGFILIIVSTSLFRLTRFLNTHFPVASLPCS